MGRPAFPSALMSCTQRRQGRDADSEHKTDLSCCRLLPVRCSLIRYELPLPGRDDSSRGGAGWHLPCVHRWIAHAAYV